MDTEMVSWGNLKNTNIPDCRSYILCQSVAIQKRVRQAGQKMQKCCQGHQYFLISSAKVRLFFEKHYKYK